MGKFVDLTGKTFNQLTVLERVNTSKNGSVLWKCRCECEKEIIVRSDHLKNNHTQSCGCLQKRDAMKRVVEMNTTHSMTGSKIYAVWCTMKARCTNPNNDRFINYGGRGITLCSRWYDFENFYEDMGSSYKVGLTIERKDNNGNYEPTNCKWASRKEQARNTTRNRFIEFRGQTKTLAEWSEITGINQDCLFARLSELHWDIERALTTPIRIFRKRAAS